MAIRSMPATRQPAQVGQGSQRQPPRNTDGPGNSHLDYGSPKPYDQRDRYADARAEHGNSPWYRRGNAEPMPWAGPPGQQHGVRAPFYTPDAGDPRNAGYWAAGPTSEELQARNRQLEAKQAADWERRSQHSGYSGAIEQLQAAGYDPFNRDNPANIRFEMQMGKNPEMRRLFQEAKTQRTLADNPGLTRETWDNRFDGRAVTPRSPSGNYQYGPGRPGPTPPGVSQSVPPTQNPGYSPGVPMNQSKSGMGQNPNMGPAMSTTSMRDAPIYTGFHQAGGGPAMSTGNPMGGMANMPLDIMTWMATGSAGNPMGGGDPNYMNGTASRMIGMPMGGMQGGGLPPQLMQQLFAQRGYNPMAGGAGMGGMGFGGFGGFNPSSMLGGGMGMGYNPGAQFSPYMNMMMGGY